jgi:Raf kinase inhibitor-like YbhB/YbcL family protein
MRRALLALPAIGLALAACGGGGERVEGPPPSAPERITLTSPAFEDGGTIPKRYTCDGDEVSPPLAWKGIPDGAPELALLVEDTDAPGGTFVHWALFNIPAGADGLAEGDVPTRARQGENSAGKAAYAGPCPPEGDKPHHYEFTLYALKSGLDLPDGAAADDVRAAVAKAALARGQIVGRFGR